MKRLEFKAELDEIYKKIEEVEENIRHEVRMIENAKDKIGILADSLEDGGFDDEGNDQETDKG